MRILSAPPCTIPRAASTAVLMAAASCGVDNLLLASDVRERIAAGAVPLRVEADFVTCSQ